MKMNAAACATDPYAGMSTHAAGAQFLQECQNYIVKNSGRQPKDPASVHDISSLVHLMKCMFACVAPILETIQKLPQVVTELNQTREELKELRRRVSTLAENYNDMLRFSYDKNALVHGIKEDDNETPESLRKSAMQVLSAAQTKPKASDLEYVRRLGPRKTGKTRPIVCRFINRSIKHRVVGDFYRKRKSDQAAAASPEAARLIRSPVTNHIPFKRLIEVGDDLSTVYTKPDAELDRRDNVNRPLARKKKTVPRTR